jgi:hypothetical protein
MVTHKDIQAAVDELVEEICPKLAALVDKFFPDGQLPHKGRTVFPGVDPPDLEEELRAGLARAAVLFAGEVGDALLDAAGLESGHRSPTRSTPAICRPSWDGNAPPALRSSPSTQSATGRFRQPVPRSCASPASWPSATVSRLWRPSTTRS